MMCEVTTPNGVEYVRPEAIEWFSGPTTWCLFTLNPFPEGTVVRHVRLRSGMSIQVLDTPDNMIVLMYEHH